MMFTLLILLLLTPLPLYLLVVAIYRLYFHPLSSFPGPWYHALSDLPINYHCYIAGDIVPYFSRLHNKYGHTVRTAPNVLSCIHSDVWHQVYAAQRGDVKENKKVKRQYPVAPEDWANNIFTAGFEDHARQRRVLGPAFSDKALREQEPMIQSIVTDLIARLSDSCEEGGVANMVDLLHFTLFDLTGLLLLGKSFGCLRDGKYHPWVGIIFDSFQLSMLVSLVRSYPIGRYLFSWLPKSLKNKEREHKNYVVEAVEKRMEAGVTETKDFVTLTLQETNEKNTLRREELMETATLFIVAGSETTATALSGLMYLLTQNGTVYDRLVREIRQEFVDEKSITIQSVQGLKYLHACLREALRRYTPVVINTCREIKPGGVVIGGRHIPAGAYVCGSHNVAYVAPANFRDPESFLPERWLPEGKGHFESDSKAVLEPFSAGQRSCIGKNLAWAEMRVIVSRLLWNFDFELMPEGQNWMKRQRSFFLWEKGALPMKMTRAVRHVI